MSPHPTLPWFEDGKAEAQRTGLRQWPKSPSVSVAGHQAQNSFRHTWSSLALIPFPPGILQNSLSSLASWPGR